MDKLKDLVKDLANIDLDRHKGTVADGLLHHAATRGNVQGIALQLAALQLAENGPVPWDEKTRMERTAETAFRCGFITAAVKIVYELHERDDPWAWLSEMFPNGSPSEALRIVREFVETAAKEQIDLTPEALREALSACRVIEPRERENGEIAQHVESVLGRGLPRVQWIKDELDHLVRLRTDVGNALCDVDEDRNIVERAQMGRDLAERLGGWSVASENLTRLDKAAEELIPLRRMAIDMEKDRDEWRSIAKKLAGA